VFWVCIHDSASVVPETTMKQEDLNREMVTGGIARYRGKNQSAQERGKETDAAYGQRLMRATLPDLYNEVRKTFTYHKKNNQSVPKWLPLIWDIPPKTVSFLALKVVLDSISHQQTIVKSSIAIGSALEDEARYNWLKVNHPDIFKYAAKDVEKAKKRSYNRIRNAFLRHEVGEAKKGNIEKFQTWGKRQKILIGTWLLETIRKATHFIQFTIIQQTGKTVRYVSATDELFEWIRAFNEDREALTPLWLPMVDKPRPWTSLWQGGYPDDHDIPALTFIKSYDMDYLRSVDWDSMSTVTNAVNHLQETPWTVNDKVLKVMRWAWDNDKVIGDMPKRTDYEAPPWPGEAAEKDEEIKREWSRKVGKLYNLNLSLRSQRLQTIKTIHLAEKYVGTQFYFPYQVDFRGRVYPVPYYLSPQGTDLAKSLLLFSESETIWDFKRDAKWLAIHGANCFGKDKLSLEQRVKWVTDKRNDIHAVCCDPQGNDWWQAADKPWQFLAFCFEWGDMMAAGGVGFKTRLPCAMDASNNGIQILSLLSRDEVGGAATNVSQTSIPADLYEAVAERVRQRLREDGSPVALTWLDFGITRKTCKRPVMVKPYGGTPFSCRAYVDEWFHEQIVKHERIDPFKSEQWVATQFLSSVVWKAMNEVLGKPAEVMKWLQTCAKLNANIDQPMTWTTPSGFPVRQRYISYKKKKVETLLGEKISYVDFNEDTDDIDRRRQSNGVSPNFVHSLDAAAVHHTVNTCIDQKLLSLAMVHDSYATQSPKCDQLAGILRHSYANIFSEDLLAKFSESVDPTEQKNVPALPAFGSLDPMEVLASEYFFA